MAALFYVATLSPLLGFIMLYTFRYSFVADHYQYVASLGPVALAAAGISLALGRLGKRRPFLKPVCYGVLLLALGVLTWRQSAMYSDAETLWRTTIARNPNSFMAHNNLGSVFLEMGRVDDAILQFQTTLDLHPDHANAHYNLGNALLQKGRVDEAIAHFQKTLDLQPNYANAHNNLGNVLLQIGRVDEAIVHFQKALDLQPDHANAHNNLGNALLQKGRVDEAIAHYQRAVDFLPDSADAHYNLGNALLQRGRINEAVAQYLETLEIQPHFAEVQKNLGRIAWVLATCPEASVRNGATAIELAERVASLTTGSDPVIMGTLAAAYAEAGRFAEAVTTAQQALQMADSQSNAVLANALRSQLKLYEAGSPFRDPGQAELSPGPSR